MNLFGYPAGEAGEDRETPLTLKEVTLSGSAAEVRHLAAFLLHAAELMERHGAGFGHEHLKDFDKVHGASKQPDFIVSRED